MDRPILKLDLSGSDGNVFVVMGLARTMLSGLKLQHLDADLNEATTPGNEKPYAEILAIVNKYVRLIDTSGMYPDYAIDKEGIRKAIDRFNEQLHTLPPTVVCAIDSLYPEFDDPMLGPDIYLSFVLDEVRWVISILAQHKTAEYERLLALLQELVSALSSAGLTE